MSHSLLTNTQSTSSFGKRCMFYSSLTRSVCHCALLRTQKERKTCSLHYCWRSSRFELCENNIECAHTTQSKRKREEIETQQRYFDVRIDLLKIKQICKSHFFPSWSIGIHLSLDMAHWIKRKRLKNVPIDSVL